MFNPPDSYSWEPGTVQNPPSYRTPIHAVCSGLYHLHRNPQGSDLARHPIILCLKFNRVLFHSKYFKFDINGACIFLTLNFNVKNLTKLSKIEFIGEVFVNTCTVLTGWGLISEIKYASTETSICVLVTFQAYWGHRCAPFDKIYL